MLDLGVEMRRENRGEFQENGFELVACSCEYADGVSASRHLHGDRHERTAVDESLSAEIDRKACVYEEIRTEDRVLDVGDDESPGVREPTAEVEWNVLPAVRVDLAPISGYEVVLTRVGALVRGRRDDADLGSRVDQEAPTGLYAVNEKQVTFCLGAGRVRDYWRPAGPFP